MQDEAKSPKTMAEKIHRVVIIMGDKAHSRIPFNNIGLLHFAFYLCFILFDPWLSIFRLADAIQVVLAAQIQPAIRDGGRGAETVAE